MLRMRKYNKKIERLCNQPTGFRNSRPRIRANLRQNLSNLRAIAAAKDPEIEKEAKQDAVENQKESIADEFLKRCNDDLDEISDSPLVDEAEDWEKVSDGSLGANSDFEDADIATVISEVETKEVPVGYRSHTVKRLQRYKPVSFFKPKLYVISSNRIIVNCVNSAKVETEEQETVNGNVPKSTNVSSDVEVPEPIIIDIADDDEKSEDVTVSPEVIPSSPKKPTLVLRRDKISIQEELDNSSEAILGLEFLVEIWEELGVKLKNYLCLLCDKEFEKEAVIEHLISIPHRIAYLDKRFPKFKAMVFKEESHEGDEEKEYLEKSCSNMLIDLDSTLPYISTHEEVFAHKCEFKEEADNVFCGKDAVDLLMKEISLIVEAKNDFVNKPIELAEYSDIIVEIKEDEEITEKEVNTESLPVEKLDDGQDSRASSTNRKDSERHRRSRDRDIEKNDKSAEKSDRSRSGTHHDSRIASRHSRHMFSHHSRNYRRKLSPSPSKSTSNDKSTSKSSSRQDSSSRRNEPSKDDFKKPFSRNCEKCHAPKRSRYSYSRHVKHCECNKTSPHSVGSETKQKEESSKENATQKSEHSRSGTKPSIEEKNVKSEKDDRYSSAKSTRHQVRNDTSRSHKSDCRSSKASKSKNDASVKGNSHEKSDKSVAKDAEKDESRSAKRHSSSHQRQKDHAKDDVKKHETKPSADQSSANASSPSSKTSVRTSPKKSDSKKSPAREKNDLSRTASTRRPRGSPLHRRSRSPIVPSRRRSKTPSTVSRRRSRSPLTSGWKRSKSPLNPARRRSPLHPVRRRSRSPFVVGRRRSRSPIGSARRRSRSPLSSTWRASIIRVRRSRSPLRLMRRGSNSRAISPRRRSRSPLQLGRKQSLSPLNKRRRRLSPESLSPTSLRRRRSRSPYRGHRSSSRNRQSPIDSHFIDSFKSIEDLYPERSPLLPLPPQQLPPENYAASWNPPHPVDNNYNYNYGYPPVVNAPYPPTTYPGFPCPPAQMPNPHIPPFPNTAFPPPELPNQPIPGLSCPNPPPVGVPPVSYAQPPMPIISVSSGYDQPPLSSNIPVSMPPLQYPIAANPMPHMQAERHPDEKIFQDLRSVVSKLFGLSGTNSQPGFDHPDSRNINPKGLSLSGNEKFLERNMGPGDIPFLHSSGPGNPMQSQKYLGDKERLYVETLQQIRKELGTSMNPEDVLKVVMRNMFPEEVMKDRALDILNQKGFEESKSPNKMGKPKLPGMSSKVEFKESSHMPKQGNIFPIVKQESMISDHFGGMNPGGSNTAAFLNSKNLGQLDNKQRKDFDFRMKNDYSQETFRHGMAGIVEREPEKKTLAQRLASVLVKLGMMDVPGPLLSEMLHKIGAFNRSLPLQDITENEIVSLLEKYGYLQRK